jgi:hypothetical protein
MPIILFDFVHFRLHHPGQRVWCFYYCVRFLVFPIDGWISIIYLSLHVLGPSCLHFRFSASSANFRYFVACILVLMNHHVGESSRSSLSQPQSSISIIFCQGVGRTLSAAQHNDLSLVVFFFS